MTGNTVNTGLPVIIYSVESVLIDGILRRDVH